MNEFLRNFIMQTLLKMVEDNVSEWQVRQYALGWYEKKLLTEEDLVLIEQKYIVEEPIEVEEIETTEPAEIVQVAENEVIESEE